jgi:hypothetical protein
VSKRANLTMPLDRQLELCGWPKPEPELRCTFGNVIAVTGTGKMPGYDGPNHCPQCAEETARA